MHINIPVKYKNLQLKETEALVVAFMTMVADEHGFEHAYNMAAEDLRRIMHLCAVVNPSTQAFANLQKIFKFAHLNEDNITLQFRDHARNKEWYTYSGRGVLRNTKYKLNIARNQNMWCYLLGMYRGSKDMIQDSHKLFEHDSIANTMIPLEINNFRIEATANGRTKST